MPTVSVSRQTKDDTFVLLSGGEIGLLLMDTFRLKDARGELSDSSFCVSTIVRLLTEAISEHGTGLCYR